MHFSCYSGAIVMLSRGRFVDGVRFIDRDVCLK